ncbi:hypothetical protein GCM10027271_42540 [Saccharopolyspora gloriosae]|uniref:Putative transcriptional regulator n=1 Tax=Saccharopolyspora gloriosae TaxID=455344 RepID=A0A840NEV0_9PSEU|nr:hypothetical protein [Saccharopolyspora gloriosae]MBB5070450.1 putative transcriptional regulator [Saccharopolyspora gloriosae]
MPAKNTKKTNTKSAKKNRAATAPAAQSDTAAPAADAVPDAAPAAQGGDGGPRTDAEGQLWTVLSAEPQTTAALAVAAGVGRSTAAKALPRWAQAGTVIRDVVGSRSVWSRPQHPAPEAAPDQDQDQESVSESGEVPRQPELAVVPEGATEEGAEAEPNSGQKEESALPVTQERLAPGALHGLVEDFLTEHPGVEFGPSKIGKELGRSSGAVNNALEKMTEKGVVVKTCEAPKRFTLAANDD